MMSKKTILLPIAYLPPVSWFSLLLKHPVRIEQHETYQRQSYRNRCLIYSERGILPLSIPVSKPNRNHTLTPEVEIYNDEKWYLKHWRAIRSAYEASPYFLYYKDEFKDFYNDSFSKLFDFDMQLIFKLCEIMEIHPQISFTDKFEKNPANTIDLRNTFSPKKPLSYLFPGYMQVFSSRHGFLPDLSVPDLLFNLGPESKSYLAGIELKL
jgi:hypothetical protein